MTVEDLKTNLSKAKTKERNFVMAFKGAACVALLLKKKPVIPNDGKELKKDFKGAQLASGRVGPSPDSAGIQFRFEGVDQVPVEDERVKKFIKSTCDIVVSVNCIVESTDMTEGLSEVQGFDDAEVNPEVYKLAKLLRNEWQELTAFMDKNRKIAKVFMEDITDQKQERDKPIGDGDAPRLKVAVLAVRKLRKRMERKKQNAEVSKQPPEQRIATAVFGADKNKLLLFEKYLGAGGGVAQHIKRFVKGTEAVNFVLIRESLEEQFIDEVRRSTKESGKAFSDNIKKRGMQASERTDARMSGRDADSNLVKSLVFRLEVIKAEMEERDLSQLGDIDGLMFMDPTKQARSAKDHAGLQDELLALDPLVATARRVETIRVETEDLLARMLDPYYDTAIGNITALKDLKKAVAECADTLSGFYKARAQQGAMTFSQQNMVPSARDLDAVAERQDLTKGLSDPSQAWALIATDKKALEAREQNRVKALNQLVKLSKEWGARYSEGDLDKILDALVGGQVATNYTFSQPPGENVNLSGTSSDPVPLSDKLMKDPKFRSLWEIGKSQASNDLNQRGSIEEQMGYGAAVKRVAGQAFSPEKVPGFEGLFDPDKEGKEAMPIYGGAMPEFRKDDGGAPRYGKSFVVWKKSNVENRTTMTPADSWGPMGVQNITGAGDPEILFALAEPGLIRATAFSVFGEARDPNFSKKKQEGAAQGAAYVEAQVHGDLTWEDVAEVIIQGADKDAGVAEKFKTFRDSGNYDFEVREI